MDEYDMLQYFRFDDYDNDADELNNEPRLEALRFPKIVVATSAPLSEPAPDPFPDLYEALYHSYERFAEFIERNPVWLPTEGVSASLATDATTAEHRDATVRNTDPLLSVFDDIQHRSDQSPVGLGIRMDDECPTIVFSGPDPAFRFPRPSISTSTTMVVPAYDPTTLTPAFADKRSLSTNVPRRPPALDYTFLSTPSPLQPNVVQASSSPALSEPFSEGNLYAYPPSVFSPGFKMDPFESNTAEYITVSRSPSPDLLVDMSFTWEEYDESGVPRGKVCAREIDDDASPAQVRRPSHTDFSSVGPDRRRSLGASASLPYPSPTERFQRHSGNRQRSVSDAAVKHAVHSYRQPSTLPRTLAPKPSTSSPLAPSLLRVSIDNSPVSISFISEPGRGVVGNKSREQGLASGSRPLTVVRNRGSDTTQRWHCARCVEIARVLDEEGGPIRRIGNRKHFPYANVNSVRRHVQRVHVGAAWNVKKDAIPIEKEE